MTLLKWSTLAPQVGEILIKLTTKLLRITLEKCALPNSQAGEQHRYRGLQTIQPVQEPAHSMSS